MNEDDDMTYAEKRLQAMLAACGEVRIGESRRVAMRERVLQRALVTEAGADGLAGRTGAWRRARTARPFATRLIAAATAVSMFGGGAVAWASESAMPHDALYPVKLVMQTAALAAAPTASLRVRLAIRMADDRLAEAAAVASDDPALGNELARRAREMLYEAAAQAGGMSAQDRDEVVTRLMAIGVRQREHLTQIAAGLPDAAQAGIMRAIARAGGQARARAIEVHLARAERRSAARARVQAQAAGPADGDGEAQRHGVGRGTRRPSSRSTAEPSTRKGQGQDTGGQNRSPDEGDGGADPGDQGQGKGSGDGKSGGGSSEGGSTGGSSGGSGSDGRSSEGKRQT